MNDETLNFLSALERDMATASNEQIVPLGNRPCPICSDKMTTQVEYGINTDVCSKHGVWLDREFDQVNALTEQKRFEKREKVGK